MLKKNFRLNIPTAALNAQAASNTELRPFVSPAYENVPIWNILPSYQLYELTFSKNVDTEAENFQTEPPLYEVASPLASLHDHGSYFPETAATVSPSASFSSSNGSIDESAMPPLFMPSSSHSSPDEHQHRLDATLDATNTTNNSNGPSHGFGGLTGSSGTNSPSGYNGASGTNGPIARPAVSRGASFSTWENSILANAHLLGRLSDIDKIKADKIQLLIHFTSAPGACGIETTSYDPGNKEFLQGDQIHGYVLLENLNKVPVLFDMFSVVFEGRVSVNVVESDTRLKPVVFYKFLNMFDYSASWAPAYFDRVDNKIDPRDGTHVQFNVKALEPGVKYKRFFNFTVPDCLLDSACESHQIPRHCQLLPSLGLDRKSFLQRLRQQRDGHLPPKKSGHSPGPYIHASENSSSENLGRKAPINPLVRDFSFPDTSINYCVEARLVGKKSAYQRSGLPGADEFIIVKENGVSMRIVPKEMGYLNEDDTLINRRFESFCLDVERIISRGHKLEKGIVIEPTRRSSTVKQVYGSHTGADRFASSNFEVLMPYKKKSLTQNPKVVGMLRAHFSREERIIPYSSPTTYLPVNGLPQRQVPLFILPLSLEYSSSEDPKSSRPPEIKALSAKIVTCTVRSNKYPIPVELSQKMKFDNSLMLKDEFEKNVVEKFSKHLQELSKLIAKHGHHKLGLDHQLMMDIKCLANLHVKNDCLKIGADFTGEIPKWSNADEKGTYYNLFKVKLNFSGLNTKDHSKQVPEHMRGSLCLIPSFESCIVARFYFALVELKLGNGDTLPMKVPIKIQR